MQPRQVESETPGEILKDDEFVDANKEKCTKVSKEMYGVLARFLKL